MPPRPKRALPVFEHQAKAMLCSAALLASLVSAQPTQALRNVKIGELVPAFAAKDLDGNVVGKRDYTGRALLMVFVRPEHEKSLVALRAVQRVVGDYTGTKLAVLAVSTKPGAKDHFRQLVSKHALTFAIALDPSREIYGDFGVFLSPTTLLIDETDVLRYELAHIPPNYERRLRIHIDQLLGKISRSEHDTVLARLKEGKRESLDASERRLALAETLVEQQKYAEAVVVLTQLRSERNSPLAAALLGAAYLGLGNVDEAGKCLDPVADTKPAPTRLKLALAWLEIHRKNERKAEIHLLDAVKTSPKKGPILYELGRLYERRGDTAQALDCYRKAAEDAYGERP